MECFEDFTVEQGEKSGYRMIPKREFNPELSGFSNIFLDLQDFRDRVRPLANDLARFDASRKYQRKNMDDLIAAQQEFTKLLDENRGDDHRSEAEKTVEEGYSSIEIAAESGADDAATPDLNTAAEENEGEKKDE